jgi:hypothetical protein
MTQQEINDLQDKAFSQRGKNQSNASPDITATPTGVNDRVGGGENSQKVLDYLQNKKFKKRQNEISKGNAIEQVKYYFNENKTMVLIVAIVVIFIILKNKKII